MATAAVGGSKAQVLPVPIATPPESVSFGGHICYSSARLRRKLRHLSVVCFPHLPPCLSPWATLLRTADCVEQTHVACETVTRRNCHPFATVLVCC